MLILGPAQYTDPFSLFGCTFLLRSFDFCLLYLFIYFVLPYKTVKLICIQGGSKSKLLILSEYVNKTEKIGWMWTNKNSYREKKKYCLIFSRETFYVTITEGNQWKPSMKLLLDEHELAYVGLNMTS